MNNATNFKKDNSALPHGIMPARAFNLEIMEWLSKQPTWQRNLFKRIIRGEMIDDSYVDQMINSLLSNKIINLEEPVLSIDDIPWGESKEQGITILGIGDLKGINALLGGQTLCFSESGMTIVYGDNGSGKSGYDRLLKKVAGARHREDILCDVFSKEHTTQVAKFTYRCSNTDLIATWPTGIDDGAFKQIHFYDEACGNDYLQKDTELSYRPSVLSLFDSLIQVIDNVSAEINQRIKLEKDMQFSFPDVPKETSAERFLVRLSDATNLDELNQLLHEHSNLDEELQNLREEEARLKSSNPEKEKVRLSAIAEDAESLAEHLVSIESILSPAAADYIWRLKQEAMQLRSSAEKVSAESFAHEPLSGVGSITWRAMWEAAERYAQEEAYSGLDFPSTEDGDFCVLCQQPLSQDAQTRLKRFRHYIQNTVQRQAKIAERKYDDAVKQLKNFEVAPENILSSLDHFSGCSQLSKEFLSEFFNVATQAKRRIIERLSGASSKTWLDLVAVDISAIRAFASLSKDAAEKIDVDTFREKLDAVIKERKECEGAEFLRTFRDKIVEEIDRCNRLACLVEVKRKVSTTSVSRQSKALAEKHVTRVVSDHFLMEARNLKLEHVVLSEPRAKKGVICQRPSLNGSGEDTRHVLSEGEQTAAGLAGFLTEVYFDESKSAVVFDDPMSSLDHQRRHNAAARMVQLAKDRQVIVFTHDLTFLAELVKCAKYVGVEIFEQTIQRNGSKVPGFITSEFPWKARDVKKRIGDLRHELAQMRREQDALSADSYEKVTSEWAGRLSETWERLIRSEVIYRVVDRSTTEVRPMLVRLFAKITDYDCLEFDAGYSACSTWARRHDKSEEVSYVAPEIDEMERELNRLDEWYKRVKKYTS